MSQPVSGLYAVTPDLADTDALTGKVEAALRGGARVVQYRNKSIAASASCAQAVQIARLCRRSGALFIVNDSIETASLSGADGVHLGRDDATVAQARAELGAGKLIGVSCYNDLDRARVAQSQGADYVAFGSFFASATKPLAVRAELELLRSAATELAVPIVAIGGIDQNNAAGLIAAGADAIAVVGALFDSGDIEAQARRFVRLFQSPTIREKQT